MRILAILQARVSSTRLPGKVLKPIIAVPMLLRQMERLQRAERIDRLLVATSSEQSDDPLAELCQHNGIDCYRGQLHDVLDRFYQAARPFAPEHVVRLTGDCPLADPVLVDRTIDFHLTGQYDYSSNVVEPTWPDGLDVEVVRFSCLLEAWREAASPAHREHVTVFIREHPERYAVGSLKQDEDLSHLRWTVDEPEDFELVRRIYEALYPGNPLFSTCDVLSLLARNPEWLRMNNRFRRNEALRKERK